MGEEVLRVVGKWWCCEKFDKVLSGRGEGTILVSGELVF